MMRHTGFLVIAASTIFTTLAIAEDSHEAVRTQIQLLPRPEDSSGGLHEYLLRELKNKDLAETAGKKNFPKWTVFEDQHIKFSYPDNPLIKVEVKTPKDRTGRPD